jgi:methionyl-tRNA formyltransferase
MSLGTALVVETVEGIIQHNVELRVQRSFIQGDELLKPAPKLTDELRHIDWNAPTKQVYNLVRGLSPFPCAYTELSSGQQTQMLKVYFGEMRCDLHAEPGTVLSDGKTYFAIATQDGALAITDLQLAGKKRMDVKSFLLGFRNPCDYVATPGTSAAEIAKAIPVDD